MLKYLYADELSEFPKIGKTMFKDRGVQFHDRLGWDVTVSQDGAERDEYDEMNPLYAIWELPDGSHGGSMRILPTTGKCMVNDHFGHFTGGDIVSPLIWESTRFCVSPRADQDAARISAAIMLAGCEVGLNFGLRHAIGVFDSRMVRIYRAMGWAPEIVGSEGTGKDCISVGLWDFSHETRQRLCRRAAIPKELATIWFDQAFGFSRAETAQALAS